MGFNLKELLSKKIVLFDGAMGTMLQQSGLLGGEIPELYNISHSEVVKKIHKEYAEAGADIITANTFGANRYKLSGTGYSVDEIITAAVDTARDAGGGRPVALDIGPIGQILAPSGILSFKEAYDIFTEIVKAGVSSGADLILIETMTDLYEAKAAILAAKENSSLPVLCTMTFEESGRTMMGTDALTMVLVLQGLGVDALGVNCSLGPKELLSIVDEILKYSSIPVMVQPNAGLPCIDCGKTYYDIKPSEFSEYVLRMAERGVGLVGGCCGTSPEFIKECRKKIENVSPKPISNKKLTAVCSSQKTVIFDDIKIIGERINPTGKKKFKEAILANNIDYILGEAVSQKNAGADILDVNVGLPEINEKEFIVKVIGELQAIMELPLQIDSSSASAIEAAARIYNGRPLINSVNGKEEVMKNVFPIVKKYGACVIGLTLDDRGIPLTAEERVSVAEKIIKTAEQYGISKEDIIIDCLVLTASAQQREVMESIRAVSMVKEKYNVKTVLGVSNVSFGLPQRECLNRTYLAMALGAGLDTAILNPLSKEMMDTISAFRVLSNKDKDAAQYIKHYSFKAEEDIKMNNSSGTETKEKLSLEYAIINGLKEKAAELTRELLRNLDSIEVINKHIIPSLNTVGQLYEDKQIYLPQLILSAETVKKSFEAVKEKLMGEGVSTISKGRIVLATVKGDIHDIGKNIVKVLLENYGFEIIDLGKDVSPEMIAAAAADEQVKLVGLSALMTTTVSNMEAAIKALKENGLECKTMVGGAVLTSKYADMIGADFYAKDAMGAVRIAQRIYEVADF